MKDENKPLYNRIWKSYFSYFFHKIFGSYFFEAHRYPEKSSEQKNWLERVYIELSHLIKIEKIPNHWVDSFYRTIAKGEVRLPLHEGAGLFLNGKQILLGDELPTDIKKPSTLTIDITSKISKTELKRFVNDNWEIISELQNRLNLPELTYPRTDFYSENFIPYLLKEHAGISMKKVLEEMQKEADKRSCHNVERNTVEKAFNKYKKLEKDSDTS